MDIQAQFETAVANSKMLAEKPSNDVLLQLYGLYKQGTSGDATGDGPDNVFDFVAKAKFNAWKEQSGKSMEAAKQEYIALVEKLKG